MNNLVIIGARGLGREVFWLAKTCIDAGHSLPTGGLAINGFLDDKTNALEGMDGYPPILSTAEDYQPKPDDVFLCALGSVTARRKYVDMIRNKGGQFISLVHPLAAINENSSIGVGCIIGRHVIISCEVEIGDYVVLQSGCTLGHDVRVGNFCQLNARCFLGGNVVVGNDVTINAHAMVHPGKSIGVGATVGAGAFVIRNVKAGATVYGNPAKNL